jgi:hypothetical protein
MIAAEAARTESRRPRRFAAGYGIPDNIAGDSLWNNMRNLARLGLVILAVVLGLVVLFELVRILIELNLSAPLTMVIRDAAIVLACTAGFAGCCLKYRQIGKAQEAEATAAAVRTAQAFKGSRLEADARKPLMAVLFLLIAAIFLFPSFLAWMTPSVKMIVIAVLGIAGTAYVGAVLLSYFRSGKPTLVIDGYALDHAWYGPIRWDQIHGLMLQEFKGQRGGTQQILLLGVAKPGRYLQQMPWVMRVFQTRKRRDAAVGDLRIPLKVLDQPAALIHAAALELRGRVSPPLLKHWYPAMSVEQIAMQRETETILERMEQLSASAPLADASSSMREAEEMNRLSETLMKNLEAGKPFRDRELARLGGMKKRLYALTAVAVLYVVFRAWWIFHQH